MEKAGTHLTTRIQEFELWRKDGDFFRDGEYAKRRAQKREKQGSLENDHRLKRWKKLYIPAILGMIAGSFLTLASTVHGLGKNTIFLSSKEIFHVVGPVFLVVGLFLLVLAAACSHREEELLRIKLGLPSMFPQKIMKTLPSAELTSITTVSELDSSHSLSEKLAIKSKDRHSMRNTCGKSSTDTSEVSFMLDANASQARLYSRERERLEDLRNCKKDKVPTPVLRKKRCSSFQSGYSIAPESVFERENEISRFDISSFKETDIDAYCAMEENREITDIKSASLANSDSLPNMSEHVQINCLVVDRKDCAYLKGNELVLQSKSENNSKSKEYQTSGQEGEHNSGNSHMKREKSRVFAFHRLVKAKDRFVSSASETSSGYSSGTNMVEIEQFECFTSFDSEQDGDMIETCE